MGKKTAVETGEKGERASGTHQSQPDGDNTSGTSLVGHEEGRERRTGAGDKMAAIFWGGYSKRRTNAPCEDSLIWLPEKLPAHNEGQEKMARGCAKMATYSNPSYGKTSENGQKLED